MKIAPPGRANGQADRITELWAWTVVDPRNDVEGIVAMQEPLVMPLVASTRTVAEQYAPYVTAIERQTGAPVRLRRFVAVEDES